MQRDRVWQLAIFAVVAGLSLTGSDAVLSEHLRDSD